MTIQEENIYIQEVLPRINNPCGYDITHYWGEDLKQSVGMVPEFAVICRRLEEEGLATQVPRSHQLFLTLKGRQVAELPGGYLAYLQQEQQRQHAEERRANLNAIGTFGSMVVAMLAFLFSLYTYFSTTGDLKALEKQVQAQATRIQALEKQVGHHQPE